MSVKRPSPPRRRFPVTTHDMSTEARKADEALRRAMALTARVAMERRAIVKKC